MGCTIKTCLGGRGEIRTHGPREGTPLFESGALVHYATLPYRHYAIFLLTRQKKNVGIQKPARYRQVNDKPAVTYSCQSIMLQLPSALVGLTSVVGMGTGVSPPLEPPKVSYYLSTN